MTVTCEGEMWFVRIDGMIVYSNADVFRAVRVARRFGF